MQMKVNLKTIKPIGGIIIVALLMLGIAAAFTVNLGVPKPYTPRHDTAYYTSSADTMDELLAELRANVFPALQGISSASVDARAMKITVDVDGGNYDKVVAVISRDFDASMFEFVKAGG